MQSRNITLLVLAAGMGSRYGGLKQIDPVGPGGETLLDYSVYDAWRAGFNRVVFVIRRDFEAVFREKVGARFAARIAVDYVFQDLNHLPDGRTAPAARVKPWGTGHAVWCAAGAVAEPFAVINGDDFYGADSFRQLHRFLSGLDPAARPVSGCMVGFRLAHTLSEAGTVARGVCTVDAAGRLQGVVECTAIARTPDGIRQTSADGRVRKFTGDEIVSLNCWGFGPAVFGGLEAQLRDFLAQAGTEAKAEFYLPEALGGLIARREATVAVLPTESDWFGITYREDRARVVAALQALVRAGVYPERLWA